MKKEIRSVLFSAFCVAILLLCAVTAYGQVLPGISPASVGTTSSSARVIADTALIFHGHTEMVRFADYSPDGSMVVTEDIHHNYCLGSINGNRDMPLY
jgi:hypothetical protein